MRVDWDLVFYGIAMLFVGTRVAYWFFRLLGERYESKEGGKE